MWKPVSTFFITYLLFIGFARAGEPPSAAREYDAEQFSYYDTIATYYQEKISACIACADTTTGRLYLDLVQAYQYDNRLTEAYASLEKARYYLEKTGHTTLLAELNISYAEYFRIAAQYTKALVYLGQVQKLIGSGSIEKRTIARYYNRRAAVAIEYEKNPQLCMYYSEKCLSLGRELNDNTLVATALNEIAYVQDNLGDTAASQNYLTAYRLMMVENRKLDASNILANYVFFQVTRKEYDNALSQALLGYSMSLENNFERALSRFTTSLVEIYTHKKDHEKALFYLQKKYEVDEIIHRKIWGRTVSELEMKYDLQHKEEQIELGRLKIDNQELQLTKERSSRNNIILFLVFTGGLLGVAVYYYFRSNKYNRKLEGLLKENQFLLSESNHRIKNNLQLISALTDQELKKKHGEEEANGLLAISAKIEAISTLHKQLYLNESKETIRIDTYLAEIKKNFMLIIEKRNIRVDFEVEAAELSIHTSTYIGLLCTELMLNSLKHAFKDMAETPHIHIVLNTLKGKVFFSYADNGCGIKDINKKLHLIHLISQQLRFTYQLKNVRGFYFETDNLANTL